MQKSSTVAAVKDPDYGSSGGCVLAAGGGIRLPVPAAWAALRFGAHKGRVLRLRWLRGRRTKPAA